jgi:DNA processing protein
MHNTLVPKNDARFPAALTAISQPPQHLYITSNNWDDLVTRPKVAIVGSRKVTPYGRIATERFATDLARAGVVIVSGLAYGVDAIAHRAALDAGGLTVAVLPTALDAIYPARHTQLAKDVEEQGGALISEYTSGTIPFKGNFVERNRIVAGLADIVLVTEAASKSGSLHTADFALDQGRDIFAVPGNITSPTSEGTNNLIRMGAAPALSPQDILDVLGIRLPKAKAIKRADPVEQAIVEAIAKGIHESAPLLAATRAPIQHFNQALTMLEIEGVITSTNSGSWRIR